MKVGGKDTVGRRGFREVPSIPNKGVVPLRLTGQNFVKHFIQQNRSFKEVLVSSQPLVERSVGSDGGGMAD